MTLNSVAASKGSVRLIRGLAAWRAEVTTRRAHVPELLISTLGAPNLFRWVVERGSCLLWGVRTCLNEPRRPPGAAADHRCSLALATRSALPSSRSGPAAVRFYTRTAASADRRFHTTRSRTGGKRAFPRV
jgi:hypothetical protein